MSTVTTEQLTAIILGSQHLEDNVKQVLAQLVRDNDVKTQQIAKLESDVRHLISKSMNWKDTNQKTVSFSEICQLARMARSLKIPLPSSVISCMSTSKRVISKPVML